MSAKDHLHLPECRAQDTPDDAQLWQRKATFLLGVLGRYDADAFETAYDLTQDSAVFFCKGALVRTLSMAWGAR